MLSILIVDDDPLLCAAMQRKIQIVDQGNGLGVQEVAAAIRCRRPGTFCAAGPSMC